MKCIAKMIDEENFKRLTHTPNTLPYSTFDVTVVSNVSHTEAAECGFKYRDEHQSGFPRLIGFDIVEDDEITLNQLGSMMGIPVTHM